MAKIKLSDVSSLQTQVAALEGTVELAEAKKALASVNAEHVARHRASFEAERLDLDPKDIEAFKGQPQGKDIDDLFECTLLLELAKRVREGIDGAVSAMFVG